MKVISREHAQIQEHPVLNADLWEKVFVWEPQVEEAVQNLLLHLLHPDAARLVHLVAMPGYFPIVLPLIVRVVPVVNVLPTNPTVRIMEVVIGMVHHALVPPGVESSVKLILAMIRQPVSQPILHILVIL